MSANEVKGRTVKSTYSESDEWRSDPRLMTKVRRRFRITLDVAAAEWNAQADRYYTKKQNALARSWNAGPGEWAYCNPPYSAKAAFAAKGRAEALAGARVLLLPPANTSEGWWFESVAAPAGRLLATGADVDDIGQRFSYFWEKLWVDVWFIRGRCQHIEASGKTGSARHMTALVAMQPPGALPSRLELLGSLG